MKNKAPLSLTVVIHETRNEMAAQLEGRIQELREPKASRRWETGPRSALSQILFSTCDVTYVVLRESWKL
ncbi:MAG: hypothetical protein WBQ94_18355 [Terracidiphilus sp.]